jgi:hypothetical protein
MKVRVEVPLYSTFLASTLSTSATRRPTSCQGPFWAVRPIQCARRGQGRRQANLLFGPFLKEAVWHSSWRKKPLKASQKGELLVKNSSVASGGAMGHLHPDIDCFAVDRVEFWLVIHRNVKLKELFGQKYPTASPSKFLATPLVKKM